MSREPRIWIPPPRAARRYEDGGWLGLTLIGIALGVLAYLLVALARWIWR